MADTNHRGHGRDQRDLKLAAMGRRIRELERQLAKATMRRRIRELERQLAEAQEPSIIGEESATVDYSEADESHSDEFIDFYGDPIYDDYGDPPSVYEDVNPNLGFREFCDEAYDQNPPNSMSLQEDGEKLEQVGIMKSPSPLLPPIFMNDETEKNYGGYVQPGAYPGPSPQYSMPAYGGYPQHAAGGYPPSWDQSSMPTGQQATHVTGYDYYGQQNPSQQSQPQGGPNAADNGGYSYYDPNVAELFKKATTSYFSCLSQGYATEDSGRRFQAPVSKMLICETTEAFTSLHGFEDKLILLMSYPMHEVRLATLKWLYEFLLAPDSHYKTSKLVNRYGVQVGPLEKGNISSFDEEYFSKFDIVDISGCSLEKQKLINEECRRSVKRVGFYTVYCKDSCGEMRKKVRKFMLSWSELRSLVGDDEDAPEDPDSRTNLFLEGENDAVQDRMAFLRRNC